MSAQQEKTADIERCIRSFIIKSIHAIVQARSGNAYTTACVSDVGARNNLMVYLEEDPEIGATIKQNLDSGFPIKIGDTFSLEILMSSGLGGGGLVVLEVWQFRLDTEENLLRCGGLPCSKIVANHSGLQPAISSIRSPVKTKPVETECLAVEDFRRSRLFERLGTLLKTLIVTTRLLPAYGYARRQIPSDRGAFLEAADTQAPGIQMCYALRRGELTLDRLGVEEGVICRQVGHLFPGLATNPPPSATAHAALLPIFLNVSVRYRGRLDDIVLLQECLDASPPRFVAEETDPKGVHRRKQFVRPAFATNIDDFVEEYLTGEDGEGMQDDARNYQEYSDDEVMSHTYVNNTNAADVEDVPYHEAGQQVLRGDDVMEEEEWRTHDDLAEGDPDSERKGAADSSGIPLQLPFSTVGIGSRGGARLAHLVVELRKKTDLELFRVPGTATSLVTQNAGASLFDAQAFGDELEGHEKRLQEFDDFLADFTALPSPRLLVSPAAAADTHQLTASP